MTELAIRLRGAVKRYGSITAVDGLDLDVPEGTCSACSGRTAPASRRLAIHAMTRKLIDSGGEGLAAVGTVCDTQRRSPYGKGRR